jgi:hypothetical protein
MIVELYGCVGLVVHIKKKNSLITSDLSKYKSYQDQDTKYIKIILLNVSLFVDAFSIHVIIILGN